MTAGNIFGTTRVRHRPSAPANSNTAGGVRCSCPGQKGHVEVPGKTDVSEKRALLAKLAESKPSPNSFGRRARFSATNTERPNSQSVRNSDNDPSTMIYWVCVPLLAAQRIARRDDSHCSLLNDRRPWEASSAVLDYGSRP
jgi:hypothetical protein